MAQNFNPFHGIGIGALTVRYVIVALCLATVVVVALFITGNVRFEGAQYYLPIAIFVVPPWHVGRTFVRRCGRLPNAAQIWGLPMVFMLASLSAAVIVAYAIMFLLDEVHPPSEFFEVFVYLGAVWLIPIFFVAHYLTTLLCFWLATAATGSAGVSHETKDQ